jgi:hypothetical protein
MKGKISKFSYLDGIRSVKVSGKKVNRMILKGSGIFIDNPLFA